MSTASPDTPAPHDSTLQSVTLTIRVLRALAAAESPIGVSELARRLGEMKARVHRHLITLRALNMVAQDADTELYRLGWGVVEVGEAALRQYDIVRLADPAMRVLRKTLGMTVGLALPSGDGMVMSHTVESENMVSVSIRKGLSIPLEGSSAGRLMLAFTPAFRDRNPKTSAEPGSRPKRTLSANDAPTIRQRRYDYSVGETRYGINSIGAPVLDNNERLIAVIVVVGTQTEILDPPSFAAIRAVQACASSVSKCLGSGAYDMFELQEPVTLSD